MRRIIILILILALPMFAKDKQVRPVTPDMVQRAASAVPELREMMRDPDSFVLTNVYQLVVVGGHNDVCYYFRSHNAMGGYTSDTAHLDDKGTMHVGGGMICNLPTDKKYGKDWADITTEVLGR
jgi:hypothetical protein